LTARADPRRSKGDICFDSIGFNYGSAKGTPGTDPARVIEGLSLMIRPGERVGLIGRSGAGKSTLVKLLLRFYEIEKGHIYIDGQDIAGVTQDTSLLNRSVLDNILYGRPDAGIEGAIQAAKR
jgi:ATP-binding cassette, subfamily B, multidrug efflux pump